MANNPLEMSGNESNASEFQRFKTDLEYRDSFLLLPREERETQTEEQGYTFSAAAAARSPRSDPLILQQPKRTPSEVFSKLGLVNVERLQPASIPQAHELRRFGRGIYTAQPALGMAAVYFRNSKEERDARRALRSDYEFVPNFPLSIPARVRMDDVPATRGKSALPASQWPLESGIAEAHNSGVRGAGVLVGVVDTGVDADHYEFSRMTIPFRYIPMLPKDAPPRDIRGFDTQGHGTHVCGILAGRTVGVAPEVSLTVASVIESETTRTSLIRVTYGLEWIMQQFSRLHVDQLPAVLSMSLGFPPTPPGISEEEFRSWLRTTHVLIRTLIRANVLPVVAIGNEGEDQFRYPGAFADVLGVGAVDFNRQVAPFSGSSIAAPPESAAKPDLVGYGVGVYSSFERDFSGTSLYQRLNGTSMATPYAAGIAALYRCRQPTKSVEEIRTMLIQNADSLPGQPAVRTGAGLARFV